MGGQAPGGAPSGPHRPAGHRPAGGTRNPLKLVVLALAGVALLALVGLVAVNLTAKPAQVAYQNDDYAVPPAELDPPQIPAPETLDQAKQWTSANALYQQQVPAPVRCDSTPIDVATADDALLKSHFESLMACLVRVWEPPLRQAGFQIYRPTVTIYGSQISTKCGSGEMPDNAFYCGADQQIYWSRTLGRLLSSASVSPTAGDEVMAHEFGHAVQGRTGILTSKNWLRAEAPSKAASLELARRNETQADCFAGMFMRSVSVALGLQQSDVETIQDNFAGSGDDTVAGKAPGEGNHGQSGTRRYWGTVGLATGAAGQCNTYVAPSNQVR